MKIIKALTFLIIAFISVISNSQIIDNFGVTIGAGVSNQYWDYEQAHFTNLSGWKGNKTGLSVYLNAEKEILPYLAIRPGIGYNQKGFTENNEYINFDGGNAINLENDKVILHNLSFDISAKVYPFKKSIYPYLLAGLKGDYLLSYRDVEYEFSGISYNVYSSVLDDYNKFVLSGILGVGASIKDALFLEFEYNPAFTKNYKTENIVIHDRCFIISLGLNLNKLYLL